MNCRKAQNLIKTCFLDDELDKDIKNDVQNHINTCESCRLLEKSLREISLTYFSDKKEIQPPISVWNEIENTINETEPQEEKRWTFDWIKRFFPPFFVLPRPTPAYAMAATVLIIMLSLLFVYKPTTHSKDVNEYLLEQANFIQDLDSNDYFSDSGNTLSEYI
jgi:hypothetical protein